MLERRKFPRAAGQVRVVYKFMGVVGERREAVVDISQGGLRLLLREKTKKGALLELNIALPKVAEPFFTLGEVVWQSAKPVETNGGEDLYATGIRFHEMGIEHKMLIIKYVYDRMKEKRSAK